MRKRCNTNANLQLVTLEAREVPATFTVTTVVDNGSNFTPTAGSLREAIINANKASDLDTINFSISGGGVQVLTPPLALPDITNPVLLDGTTQPGFAGTPVIRLDGSSAGTLSNGLSLVNHNGSTVRSVSIGNFGGAGIRISGGGSHTVYGSLIGTTQNGTAAAANGIGINLENATLGNVIGGNGSNQRNIISGNAGAGVRMDNTYSNLVAGNLIGSDLNGTAAVANSGGGVSLSNGATGNTIGGIAPGLGNIISGNGTAGVLLTDAATNSNIIVGNRIGLSLSGSTLPNTGTGVKAFNAAGSNPPGGSVAGSENVVRNNTIAQNSGAGVAVLDTARQVRIEGNSIRDNGGLGIQRDATANNGLGAPTITNIKSVSGGLSVNGTFTGLTNTKYTVLIFTNSTADASGAGEGGTQVGNVTVTTDGVGAGTFTFLLPTGTGGAYISSTVTDTDLGDTSAFSNAYARPDSLLTSASFAVGGGAGGGPLVVFTDIAGTNISNVVPPFGVNFTGGTRVATGDLTGDGIPDLIVGTGVGTQALVRVTNSATQQLLFSINPFGDFTRGVFVALGDVNNDGYADIIITPDEGGGSRVRVFNGKTFVQIADFFGIQDVNFRGGARAAVGDMNNDKYGDIAVSAGFGGGPRIAVFSGITLASNGGPKLFGDFFAFESSLRNGAFVAVADVNGDGYGELIVAAGPGGAPRVRILNGKTLVNSAGASLVPLADFFAGDSSSRGGVRIMARDLDGDGFAELISAQADGNTLRRYSGFNLKDGNVNIASQFNLLDARTGGVFVG
ncbi:hypothetical protein BH11PLA2_BH11PLA2_05510 [soil metagenome]